MEKTAVQWLFLDGLLPLFGAAVLFWVWGLVRLSTTAKRPFSYAWKEALDPMGWLYGSAILSIQSIRWMEWNTASNIALAVAGFASILLLLSAMTNRGEDTKWKPPRSLEVVSVVLILATLVAGYTLRSGQRALSVACKSDVKQLA